MRGLRTWRGSVMALCVVVALAGLTVSSTLANEPKPETASAPPKTAQSSYKPYFVEFRSRAAASLRPHVRNLRPAKWARRNRKK